MIIGVNFGIEGFVSVILIIFTYYGKSANEDKADNEEGDYRPIVMMHRV